MGIGTRVFLQIWDAPGIRDVQLWLDRDESIAITQLSVPELGEAIDAAGMEKVLLGVDAENPSGATRLYESVGFRRQPRTLINYIKQL